MKFEALVKYLAQDMRLGIRGPKIYLHQPIAIMTLLECGGSCTTELINNRIIDLHDSNVDVKGESVYKVLDKHDIISKNNDKIILLNHNLFDVAQIDILIMLCRFHIEKSNKLLIKSLFMYFRYWSKKIHNPTISEYIENSKIKIDALLNITLSTDEYHNVLFPKSSGPLSYFINFDYYPKVAKMLIEYSRHRNIEIFLEQCDELGLDNAPSINYDISTILFYLDGSCPIIDNDLTETYNDLLKFLKIGIMDLPTNLSNYMMILDDWFTLYHNLDYLKLKNMRELQIFCYWYNSFKNNLIMQYDLSALKLPRFDGVKENIDGTYDKTLSIIPKAIHNNTLPKISKEILDNKIRTIQKDILIDEETIREIVYHILSGRHVLLFGSVGVGKSQLAKKIPSIWNNPLTDKKYGAKIYTATSDWSSADIIAGIEPRTIKDNPVYKIKYGCVVTTILHNNDKDREWLIIDEFNRASMDEIFGQLFTSLEEKSINIPVEEKIELEKLKIPDDYRIIGTLNPIDGHYIFNMSDALKRRFAHVKIKTPDTSKFENEMYYALRNAKKDLNMDVKNLFILDDDKKIISRSNSTFEKLIWNAQYIFMFIRSFRDLGTGILKSIYQTILSGYSISENKSNILDYALNANITPQLNELTNKEIEVIIEYCYGDLTKFFHRVYESNNVVRAEYAKLFSTCLKFLNIGTNNIETKFREGKNIEWQYITQKYVYLRSDIKLELFRRSLNDLKH